MNDPRIVFVAGLSGAGKSQAMKTFEDLGFYCVEHLPPTALPETLRVLDRANIRDVAVTLAMGREFSLQDALNAIDDAATTRSAAVVYLEARNDVLVRRFSETRRLHPFADHGSLRSAIAAERDALVPIRDRATMIVDTTAMTHGALKDRIALTFAPEDRARLSVTLVPFGFKYGIPLDIDLLFDVRFLRNPNYDDALRPLTGDDPAVATFIETDDACATFIAKMFDMVDFLLPRYIAEGKAQLTIGIGCTGGRHRSVYIARRIEAHLRGNERVRTAFDARDVGR